MFCMVRPIKVSENVWEIPKQGKMNVAAQIYASDKLMEAISKDKTLNQVQNVACLPGILMRSIAMPDAHQGYGFSIGGVAAFDVKKGVVSPGGVGYDINCGVRLLATNISVADFLKVRESLTHDVKRNVPTGVGFGNKKKLSDDELIKYLVGGAQYAVGVGFGVKDDFENSEEGGRVLGANPNYVSERAKARGSGQLGTLGAGNHFLEFQVVDEIFDEEYARKWGLQKGKVCVMIHCGSRGLGHQVASDYIKLMEKEYGFEDLPDRELVNAPIESDLGKRYIGAMNCAINFAFANRQVIMHRVRDVLMKYFPKSKNRLVYDVAHNIAKFEEHKVDGKKRTVCIHRKGATRAFPKQPVIIPGSMGTASYVLVGTEKALEVSFGSTAHGAGRVMSRSKAISTLDAKKIKSDLQAQNIHIEAGSLKGVAEEAPEVYKDIEEVVKVSDEVGIAKKVVRLRPLSVIKG